MINNENRSIVDNVAIRSFVLNRDTAALIEQIRNSKAEMDVYGRLILLKILSKENPDMLALLGDCYYSGFGVKEDIPYSIKLFKDAEKQGSVRVLYDLAWYYYSKSEYVTAIDYFEKCKKNKDFFTEKAIQNIYGCLGASYLDIVEPKYGQAIENLMIAAEKYHDGFAYRRLGLLYGQEGRYFEPEKCISNLELAAAEKDIRAINILGNYYLEGNSELNITESPSKALTILLPHKEIEDNEILYNIGRAYLNSEPRTDEYMIEALRYFERSFQLNNNYLVGAHIGYAAYCLGEYKKAKEMLLYADKNGVALFSDFLGRIFAEDGDLENAIYYYGKAYNEKGMNNLFTCCEYLDLLDNAEKYADAYRVACTGIEQYNDIYFAFYKGKYILLDLVSVAVSKNEAADMLEACVRLENKPNIARRLLADYYLSIGQYRKAEKHFLDAFNAGDADAGVYLGRLYEKGGGSIKSNIDLALGWYRKAGNAGSELGNLEANCFKAGFFGGYRRVRNL